MGNIEINEIKLVSFNHKTLEGELEVFFTEKNITNKISRKVILKDPIRILQQLMLDVKSKNKIIFDDSTLEIGELLDKYSPILIKNPDETEDKLLNFLKSTCEKSKRLRSIRDAREHMKLYDQLKTASLRL